MSIAALGAMRHTAAVAFVLSLTSIASAEPLSGRVLDRKSGAPVEGAVVYVAGPDGFERTASSDKDGRYQLDVAPGQYSIVFLHGRSKLGGQVVVEPGVPTKLDGRVDARAETITLESIKTPKVMPQPRDSWVAFRAPPYSDAAILSDAWTRAWLLLDVDEHGKVSRLKVLNHVGYDLEPIAIAEGFKVEFSPGKDDQNRPVPTLVVWPIEWPANSWLLQFGSGVRTRMPQYSFMTARNSAGYVPCQGDGPWMMTALFRGYRDCSRANLKAVETEAWVLPSE